MEDIGVSKSDVVIAKQLKGCVYAYLGKVSDPQPSHSAVGDAGIGGGSLRCRRKPEYR